MTDSALAAGPGTDPLTDPGAYPTLREAGPRYGDLGPDGHVSTLGLARWFEEARIRMDLPGFRYLTSQGDLGPVRILLAAQRVRRRGPMPYTSGAYRLGAGVRRVGRSSFTYGYGVFAGERCVALGDTVAVFLGADGSAELPEALRDDLAGLAIDAPAEAPRERPGPERRDPAAYPFAVDLRARLGDIDTNRHGNNVAVASWYTDAVAALQLDLLGQPAGGPPSEIAPTTLEVQYETEVAYPATYRLGVGVSRLDDSVDGVVGYACGLFRDDRCVGLADLTAPRAEATPAGLERYRL